MIAQLNQTKPLDTNVNSELWLYFTMQFFTLLKITFSIVYIEKVDTFNPPPPPIRDKGKKHPIRSKVKAFLKIDSGRKFLIFFIRNLFLFTSFFYMF